MKQIVTLLVSLLLLTACEKESGSGYNPPKLASQTVLVYMPGTSLDGYFARNVRAIEAAVSASVPGDGRILICRQVNQGTAAELQEIYFDTKKHKVARLLLKSYTTFDAGDPMCLHQLLADAAETAPAQHYGLIIGCHGKAWIPAEAGILALRSVATPGDLWTQMPGALDTRSFGDRGHELDITELADALRDQQFKPEYLIFDDCFMASIEVLYDLRGVVDKVIASPCEIMANGFPYDRMVPWLFTDNGAGYDLPKVCYEFWNVYMKDWESLISSAQSGCISLVVVSEMDALANVMRRINAGAKKPYNLGTLQNYEGLTVHAFYDLKHYVESMCADEALLSEFNEVLERAIPKNCRLYTPFFYSAYNQQMNPVTNYSGISVSDPSLHSQASAYHSGTSWYQATH